ncbi:(3,5-dihydroxyphenyl)acetyl-CoA 1,2-dioxygenase DpgC [Micromonospora sp. LOL_024]|uniref:(3,5-dihydroxyphenyl)acetyl-CoA 1,2-dioxygenase DpgC n=1 Tax=Micromonospora sp. LOL_024 TaxID=3345412 RepID=UPI003A8C5702
MDLTGELTRDAELLARLPVPSGLAPSDGGHDSCRALRHRFLHRHAAAVYDRLTDGRTRHRRIADLVYAAADRFPGLVPTRAQMDAERLLPQAGRAGREIDQGIFFRALLRVPDVGGHLMDSMALPSPRALDLLDAFDRDGHVALDTLDVRRQGPAAHVTVTNDHCLNAEDEGLVADMETAVDLVTLTGTVRVGVLRGGVMTHPRYRGRRVFSAGINLAELCAGRISLVGFLLQRELGYVSKLIHGVLADPAPDAFPDRFAARPWLAVVDGFAIGGGTQLLLACDRVIAVDDAYLSLPAAREGIVPGAANLRLSRMTGGRLARRVILGGERIGADDPAVATLVDEVVPTEQVDAAVDAAVAILAEPAVLANRRMMCLAEEPRDRLREYLAEFAYLQATRAYSPDVLARLADWHRPAMPA